MKENSLQKEVTTTSPHQSELQDFLGACRSDSEQHLFPDQVCVAVSTIRSQELDINYFVIGVLFY
jgi:hypothetical protein